MKALLTPFVALALFGCSGLPIARLLNEEARAPLTENTELLTVDRFATVPAGSQQIGRLIVGGMDWAINCSYTTILEKARQEARQAGANVLQVVNIANGTLENSSCPEITFHLYQNNDEAALTAHRELTARNNASTLSADADYALVHLYHDNTYYRSGISKLHLYHYDGKVASLAFGQKFTYRLEAFGPQRFRPGKRRSYTQIDVQPGQEYYLKLLPEISDKGIRRLTLVLMNNFTGRIEAEGLREVAGLPLTQAND
ncbi:MAG: hypothetical protein AAFZ52_19495 [Bacteroidota bacterium]